MTKLATIVQRQLKHDAPYAWFLRYQASTSPVFHSQHVAELDSRLESYLTCFQLNQQERDVLLAKLRPIDWGTVFITALVALRHDDAVAFARAVAMLTEDQQAKELSDALCRVEEATARPYIEKLYINTNPLARIAAITASGFFNVAVENNVVTKLLNDTPAVIAATLKIMGNNKRTAYKEAVANLLTHDNEAVRFEAAYAGCLLNIPAARVNAEASVPPAGLDVWRIPRIIW